MKIFVKFTDGPKSDARELDQPVVRIGRVKEICDIIFDKSDIRVGREHCLLESHSGGWYLRTLGDHPVFIDNAEAMGGERLPNNCLIGLGAHGPELEISYTDSDDYPSTFRQPRENLRVVALATRKTTRTLLVVACLATIVLISIAGLWVQRTEKQKWENVIASTIPSVYLVVIEDSDGSRQPAATAWVVDQEHGVLATNAHVAHIFSELSEKQSLKVIGSHQEAALQVASAKLHPGYELFTEVWDKYQPVLPSGEELVRRVNAACPTCDVGLLYVNQHPLPRPALKVADSRTVGALATGASIAYVGFPLEGISLDGVNMISPTPIAHIAVIGRVTDVFGVESVPSEDRYLIQHGLPASGGASGSPIIDRNGKVVGIHSAGNVIGSIDGVRVESSAQIFYAQRIDLLSELIDGTADTKLSSKATKWNSGLKQYYSPINEIKAQSFLTRSTNEWSEEIQRQELFTPHVELVTDITIACDKPDGQGGYASGSIRADLKQLELYQVLVACEQVGDPVELSVSLTSVPISALPGFVGRQASNASEQFVPLVDGEVEFQVYSTAPAQGVRLQLQRVARPTRTAAELMDARIKNWSYNGTPKVITSKTLVTDADGKATLQLKNLTGLEYLVTVATNAATDIQALLYNNSDPRMLVADEQRVGPEAFVVFYGSTDTTLTLELLAIPGTSCDLQLVEF